MDIKVLETEALTFLGQATSCRMDRLRAEETLKQLRAKELEWANRAYRATQRLNQARGLNS